VEGIVLEKEGEKGAGQKVLTGLELLMGRNSSVVYRTFQGENGN